MNPHATLPLGRFIGGHDVENVSEACSRLYLGMNFSEDGRMEGELERRIGIAMSTVGAMKGEKYIWKQRVEF